VEPISNLGCLAIGFTMLGAYVQAQPIEIKTFDNIDGMSQATTAVGPGLVRHRVITDTMRLEVTGTG
jgi:hypothetical protein